MAKQLLTERECPFPFRPLGSPLIMESADKDGTPRKVIRATGVFQNYLRENSNGRVYPKSIWDRLLNESSPFMKRIKEREVLGVIEHPEDGQTHLRYVSHVITEVRYATSQEIANSNGKLFEGDIVGTYETLPFGDGTYLAGLHESNIGFGISSRGQGNVVNRDGKKIVEDDFDLETWDVVYNPSVKHARPRAVESGEKENGLTEATLKEGDAQPGYDLPVKTHGDLMDALYMMGFESEDGIRFHKEGNDQKVTCSIYADWLRYDRDEPESYEVNCAGEKQEFKSPAEVWQFISSKESILERFNPGLLFKSRALARHRKGDDKEKAKEKEEVSESIHPTPPTMTKLDELRSLKGGIIRLLQTETKKLKASDKAAILEEITSNRMKIDGLISESPNLTTEGQKLLKRLQEFEDMVDAPETPEAPEAPENEAPESPEVEAPLPDEAKEVISKAAEMLKDLGGDSEEAQQTAEELEALCSCEGGDVGGEDEETDFVDSIPVAESKIKAIGFVKRYRTLEAIHKATLVSAARLLEKVREGRAKNISESTERSKTLREYKEAATELAEMYNQDMIATGLKLLEATNPEFYAENAERLKGFRTFKKFTEAVEGALAKAPAARKKVAESKKEEVKQKQDLKEDASKKEDAPKKTVTESTIHPALSLVMRNRRK